MRTIFVNAYLIEVIQCGFSIAGFFLLFWALFDVVKDAIGLPPAERWERRGTLAVGKVHEAFFLLLLGAIFAGLGIAGVLLPPPPLPEPLRKALSDLPEVRLGVYVMRVGLIAGNVVLLAAALVGRIFRVRHVRRLRFDMSDAARRRINDRRSPGGRP